MPLQRSAIGKQQDAAALQKIKALQRRIRLDADKHGDEHKAWSFQLDIYIEGVLLNNPACQKALGLMDKDVPSWRMHAALDFAKEFGAPIRK